MSAFWPNQVIYYLSTSGQQLSLIPGNTVTLQPQTSTPSLSTGVITTSGPIIFPGNHYLSTIGGVLVYDGNPVVEPSTLSSLAQWAYEPALSSINVAGNDILNASSTQTNTANISSATISTIASDTITASTINTSTINVTNLNYVSTYAYTSTISSILFEGDKADIDQVVISSLNGVPVSQVITPYVLPPNVDFSTVKVADTLSTANLFAGSLGGTLRMGGFPDTPLTYTSFANTQTHGAALGDYTINALGGDLVLNGSNDILVNSSNDFTVTAGDINLTQTDATSIFNLTTTGAAVMAFGLALDITTTSYLAINSGGNVSIGSANLLGADTEIEKVGFKENQIYKAGADDLEIADVSSINGYKYIPTQLWASTVASQNVNMNGNTLSNANSVITSNLTVFQNAYTSSFFTSSIGCSNDLNFGVGGSINTNGSVVNLTGSEIHNASLMHSRNNSNLFIETKGSGALILSSLSTVASVYLKANSIETSSLTTQVANASTLNVSTVTAVSTFTNTSVVSSIVVSTLCAGGLSTPISLLTLRGGNSATATNGTPQLSFDWSQSNGGFTHWITTRHNSVAANSGNALDFWINNSTTAGGSTAPGTGNCNIMSITGAGVGINLSSPTVALDITGAMRVSTVSMNTISSQQLNVSTVAGTKITGTSLVYTAVAVTSSGNATFTVTDAHTYIINTYTGGPNATFTLPTASSYQGRVLFIKNNAAATGVISASANVYAQAGGALTTTILAAGTTKWCILVSDGSNWVTMCSG